MSIYILFLKQVDIKNGLSSLIPKFEEGDSWREKRTLHKNIDFWFEVLDVLTYFKNEFSPENIDKFVFMSMDFFLRCSNLRKEAPNEERDSESKI